MKYITTLRPISKAFSPIDRRTPDKTARRRAAIITSGITAVVFFAFGIFQLSDVSAKRIDDEIYLKNSLAVNDVVRRLAVGANDVVYNPHDQKLYVSRSGTSGSGGNSISSIDPIAGQTLTTVYIGSEPNRLALADDGHTMYVGLDGNLSVRRFDTDTQTPGMQFALSSQNGQYLAIPNDLAVVPGSPDRVAVTYSADAYNPSGEAALYNNGLRMPSVITNLPGTMKYLAFSDLPTKLYGTNFNNGLAVMAVSDSGLVDATPNNSVYAGRIKYSNGKLLSSNGQVFDAASRTVVGTCPNVFSNAFAVDPPSGRVFYSTWNSGNQVMTIRAFDINTFLDIGSLPIPNVKGDAVSMVRYGTNGLAITTADRSLILVQTSLIPTNDPLPTPTPSPSATPTPSPTPIQVFIRRMPTSVNSFVYSEASQRFYASIPSSEYSIGNSIQQIEPVTGDIEDTTFIGSEPNVLALSGDQQSLFVGIDGAGAVKNFDVNTHQPGPQFPLGINYNGPLIANEIEAQPGSANAIAVVTYEGGGPVTRIYDSGIGRAQSANIGSIKFRTSTELIGGSTATARYSLGSTGLSFVADISNNSGAASAVANGLMYTLSGRVIDPVSRVVLGSFGGLDSVNSVTVDVENNKAIYLSRTSVGTEIRAYDLSSFVFIGSIKVPNVFVGTPSHLTRWGTNGIAFRGEDTKMYLLQSDLISNVGAVPSPTPTVSPCPTPSPLDIPTFVRQVNLPVNDIVYNSQDQTLYASVDSSAPAAQANSITRIAPTNGQIGSSVSVGSGPGRLALADDGQTLYTVLGQTGKTVRKVNIQTLSAGPQFNVPSNLLDIKVMPGSPQTIAGADGQNKGVTIYDNGVPRPNSSTGGAYGIYTIDFATPDTIFGLDSNTSARSLEKFSINSSGVTPAYVGSINPYGAVNQMIYADGLLYFTTGTVYNPQTKSTVGLFQMSGAIAVDLPNHRIYFVSGNVLSAFDTRTFRRLGIVTLPTVSGFPTSLVRWGENGLALRTSINNAGTNVGQLYLIQSALVSNALSIPKGVQLSNTQIGAYEPNSSGASLTVIRTGDLSSAETFEYTTTDGTAHAGSDYSSPIGSIAFLPGESSKTKSIPIINDNIYEPQETFTVSLTSPTSGTELLSPATALVTIFDDDQRPSIAGGNTSVNEWDTGTNVNVLLQVSLSNPSSETVTVNYATANGTATAGSDYLAVNGTLTFAPLETTKIVPIVIVGDNTIEGNETFSLNLTSPTNGSIPNALVTVTIIDNNPALYAAVSGKVLTSDGHGLRSASVSIKDSQGVRRTVLTNSFGLFTFDKVLKGNSYTITVSSKRFRFNPQIVSVSDDLTLPDFVGQE